MASLRLCLLCVVYRILVYCVCRCARQWVGAGCFHRETDGTDLDHEGCESWIIQILCYYQITKKKAT
jgi:hypothetical protein